MRDGQHQALLNDVVSQGNHPAPPLQKPECLQKTSRIAAGDYLCDKRTFEELPEQPAELPIVTVRVRLNGIPTAL
jgi:hypothetical protein